MIIYHKTIKLEVMGRQILLMHHLPEVEVTQASS